MLLVKKSAKTPADRRKGAARVISNAISRALGVKIMSVGRKQLRAEMRVKPLHLNNAARVNGGVLMAFADVVGAAATVANLKPGERTSTLESKTNFFAAGLGPVMKATAELLHAGRTTMVWQTTIRNSSDNSRVAIVTQTQIRLPAKAAAPVRK
jgi:1,4-dihydroxy-2-naphthoyl-CoA hydrolase